MRSSQIAVAGENAVWSGQVIKSDERFNVNGMPSGARKRSCAVPVVGSHVTTSRRGGNLIRAREFGSLQGLSSKWKKTGNRVLQAFSLWTAPHRGYIRSSEFTA
ncbi:MAG: hypothetical protein JWO45_2058 [Spartobacteria bacterium]|nr:hypothetical protein [Spartobacteria bacterium]